MLQEKRDAEHFFPPLRRRKSSRSRVYLELCAGEVSLFERISPPPFSPSCHNITSKKSVLSFVRCPSLKIVVCVLVVGTFLPLPSTYHRWRSPGRMFTVRGVQWQAPPKPTNPSSPSSPFAELFVQRRHQGAKEKERYLPNFTKKGGVRLLNQAGLAVPT